LILKLNRRELRKVISDFRSVSSRLVNVDWQDYGTVLPKFIDYVENNGLINAYVRDCGQPTFDIAFDMDEVRQGYGRVIFSLGDSEQEEVANIYGILKYCIEKNIDIPRTVAVAYSHSKSYQDKVRSFNQRVVMVLITHIGDYLKNIGIDMGVDEEVKYSITVNHGQVNVANDNSTINATQNIGTDIAQLQRIFDEIRGNTCGLSDEDIKTVNEGLEIIADEMANEKPKKRVVEFAMKGLNSIKYTAEFSAAIAKLAYYVTPLLA